MTEDMSLVVRPLPGSVLVLIRDRVRTGARGCARGVISGIAKNGCTGLGHQFLFKRMRKQEEGGLTSS